MKNQKLLFAFLSAFLMVALAACGSDDDDSGSVDNGPPPSYGVTGTVVDFLTGDPVATATVKVEGILPEPKITSQGADFTLDGIPPASVFYLLSTAPDYTTTYNKATEVVNADQSGLKAEIVKQTDLEALAAAFTITLDVDKSVLIGRVLDDKGAPLAGVKAENFELPEQMAADGPFFLDANRVADPALTATSSSGYFVFFNLEPKPISIATAMDGEYGLTMPVSPSTKGAVTLSDVVAREGGVVPVPTNVSFSKDVVPIFTLRSCVACHDKKAAGNAVGGLDLTIKKPDGIYNEITLEASPAVQVPRVNKLDPAASLLLTKPGPPAGDHPNLTFASADDPDFVKILVWITEGALNN